ncbi:hypothetical protein G6K96_21815 [Agrobacterium vitis]|uniref:hypothetical protein n=1 Tax=Agrobacterium vitis TaxID=373 RepID=UPI0015719BAC|nr:hypothetical protein [Agrobacterium vitis]NTA34373.1 hypothetical protein [Agrobacterium vitis]
MKRRGFLGIFAGAVATGPQALKAATDDAILRSTGIPSGIEVAGASPCQPAVGSTSPKVINWIKRIGIPEWKMQEIRMRADHDRVQGLDPDLAVLRSVSAGYKAVEQRRRNVERRIAQSLTFIDIHHQRQGFAKKVLSKFGYDLHWYD